MERASLKRASQLDMTFSKYVQTLIRVDLNRKLIQPMEVA
jgi:hypothetical protein